MKSYKSALAILLIVGAGIAVWLGAAVSKQRQWRALQAGQMATILRLGEIPPPGWNRDTWRNALVTPHNVWGNVIYHPSSSEITIGEMRNLQSRLDQIVGQATPQTSFDSVDQVFALLLERGRETEFISGFREEFQTFRDSPSGPARTTDPGQAPEQPLELESDEIDFSAGVQGGDAPLGKTHRVATVEGEVSLAQALSCQAPGTRVSEVETALSPAGARRTIRPPASAPLRGPARKSRSA